MEYTELALIELEEWKREMSKPPSFTNRITKSVQSRVNQLVPEQLHQVVTIAIKQMVRGVVFGANMTTFSKDPSLSFENLEEKIRHRIKVYRYSAAVEGGVTGAGGFLMGLADFPLWLSIKMKMLYEIASYYGVDLKDYQERIYLLHIFQLTFSSQEHRNQIYDILKNWDTAKENMPKDISAFDWRTFQLEYRDYIDLAKLFQLIPLVGAAVGAYVNHRLTDKLGSNAMNAYRLRVLNGIPS